MKEFRLWFRVVGLRGGDKRGGRRRRWRFGVIAIALCDGGVRSFLRFSATVLSSLACSEAAGRIKVVIGRDIEISDVEATKEVGNDVALFSLVGLVSILVAGKGVSVAVLCGGCFSGLFFCYVSIS